MANKELTAKVRLDASQAHKTVDKLVAKLKLIDKAVNSASTANGIDKKIEKAVLSQEKLKQATFKTQLAEERVATQKQKTFEATNKARVAEQRLASQTAKTQNTISKINSAKQQTISKTTNIVSKVSQWASNQNKVNGSLKSTNGLMGTIGSKLKQLAGTYLGVMGMKAIVNTSDMITNAENKLNYVSAQQQGAGGTNADGSYSTATLNATQEAMDKMYVSSQKVRMGYGDMMSNVSKSMALAGNAFDNNTDKAIRFQEIMAEAYAVGGASAQEMSSSMYQLIQALGSGTLAGDELRSVREGAPLAYQAIEEFAQKVYGCKDSLKDMASEGKITSDIVTAAILDAGGKMDSAFAQTEQTFDQTWTQIKNVGIKAFEPVAEKLREGLNNAIDSGLVDKATTVFSGIANGILIAFGAIKTAATWVVDNWNWLKHIIVGVIAVFLALKVVAIASAIASAIAWLASNLVLVIIIASIALIIYMLYLWAISAISTGELIMYVLTIIALAIFFIGIVTGSTAMIIIGIILMVVVIAMSLSSNLCEFIINLALIVAMAICLVLIVIAVIALTTGIFLMSIPMMIALLIVALILVCLGAFLAFAGEILGGAYGIWEVIKAVCANIGIAFQNAWYGAQAAFWDFVADCIDGLSGVAKIVEKIAKALGADFDLDDFEEGFRDKADAARGKMKDYNDVGDAWETGYNNGYNKGTAIQDSINGFGDQINNLGSQFQGDGLGGLMEGFGLGDGSGLPSLDDPANNLSNLDGFDPEKLGKGVGNIDDNTGAMADSMELADEDIEYLRKIAEMEWKKEYTTANITVDMSNYNTINGETDLDGIVTKLADKLYEEMNVVANGTYAY